MKQGTDTICPFSLRTHKGCPVAGATTSLRSVALKTIDETIYIVPSWGSGKPTTSPKDCVQQSFSMSEKTADTRAMPSLSNTRPSLRVIACGVKFLYFIFILILNWSARICVRLAPLAFNLLLKLNSLVRDGQTNPKSITDDVEVAVARVKAF